MSAHQASTTYNQVLLRIQSTLDSWLRCGEKYTKVIENMAKSWESHGPWCLLYRQLHQPGTAYLKNRKNFRARWFHPPLWVGMYLTWIKIRYILYASFHLNLRIFVAICSWFHGKIFNNCLQISVFWKQGKKVCKKTGFRSLTIKSFEYNSGPKVPEMVSTNFYYL